MRQAARVDLNQKEIVDALRSVGCTVQSLAAVGKGVPDLLVGYLGTNHLLEVKSERGILTTGQSLWFGRWNGDVKVVRDVESACRAVGVIVDE